MRYKRCPRCEINFILHEEELCTVCKKEIEQGLHYEEENNCAICGEQIAEDEIYCQDCKLEIDKFF